MKNIIKLASVAAVALALTQSLQAVPISGNITFSGSVQLNSSSAATATAVTSWVAPIITGNSSGAFAAIAPNTAVTMSPAIWNFNTVTAIPNFWSVGGFSFSLATSFIVSQFTDGLGLGHVSVDGTGLVSGPTPYSSTQMIWTFSIDDPNSGGTPPTWTFRASETSLPDGGSTVMLLGLALSGVALLRKKLTA